MGPAPAPPGGQTPGAHDEGGGQLLKVFHAFRPTATAERTKGRLLGVPLQDGSWATFSEISLFSSAVVTNEEPSRKIFAITTNDLEMSTALKHHDLRHVVPVAPQEKWMALRDVSVTGSELGSKVSPVESLNSRRTLWPHVEKLLPAALG